MKNSSKLKLYSEDQIKRKKIYETWNNMIQRCQNPKNKNYGGRGITVCDRWIDMTPVKSIKTNGRPVKQGFLNFYEDMENEWSFEKNSIDRINNDGNYEPSNCQWLTRSQNVNKELKELVVKGTHPFLGGKIQSESNQKRINDGTHNFLIYKGTIWINNKFINKRIHKKELLIFVSNGWQKGRILKSKENNL